MRDESDGRRPLRVILIGKPGCHLCDEARTVVSRVAVELGVSWAERSILEDRDLYDRYWERIPVTLVDGRPHDYWRVDAARLRVALSADAASDAALREMRSAPSRPRG